MSCIEHLINYTIEIVRVASRVPSVSEFTQFYNPALRHNKISAIELVQRGGNSAVPPFRTGVMELAQRVCSSQWSSVLSRGSTPALLPSTKQGSFEVYPYDGRVGTILVERENRSFSSR